MTAYIHTNCPYASSGACGHSWTTEDELDGTVIITTHYCMWNKHFRFDKHDCACGEPD